MDNFWKKYSLALVGMACLHAQADDIEIYVKEGNAGYPYVHFMLDYRPSAFNTLCTYGEDRDCKSIMTPGIYDNLSGYADGDKVSTYAGFVAVLEEVLQEEQFNNIKMALVAPNSGDGGTILKGYTHLGTGRDDIVAVLKSIPEATQGSHAHKLSPKETYFEWFRYLTGGQVEHGKNTSRNFTAGPGDKPVPDFDTSTLVNGAGNTYESPLGTVDECPKMYSVMMAMNVANQDDDLDDKIAAEMSPLAANNFENMLTWLHDSETDLAAGLADVDGRVNLQKTWVISDSGSVGSSRDWAAAGGSGSPLDLSDPTALYTSLINAFKEVISVSSTFVAASVPVNVFNQAKALDNLYVALFEAQPTLDWPGNIKKLKLVDTFDQNDPNDPTKRDGIFDAIVDVNGEPGFESIGDDKGRISFDALTFWTDVDTLPPGDGEVFPDGADGREVKRGGAGQKVDGFAPYDGNDHFIGDSNSDPEVNNYGPRQVFLEPASVTNGSQNTLLPFNVPTGSVPGWAKALLDPNDPESLTDDDAKSLIRWGRGQDSSGNPRPWLFADAIHSRPFALNYGNAGGYSTDVPNIRLFIGTGDGLFHIIENTDAQGNETGREVFAFYPRELIKNIKLRKENTISSSQMRYGVDGEPVVYTKDVNSDGNIDHTDGDKAYVFFGLRRGGNSYYALDVSDPDNTYMLWKITQTSGGDFDELGMTFSTPIVGKVKYGANPVDVLIFGGGYNGGWNADYTARVGKDLNDDDDTVGNAIYIVNLHTGELIWKAVQGTTGNSTNSSYAHAGMVDSIPSKVAVLENEGGIINRVYVGDTGGAVWRVDLPTADGTNEDHRRENWFITKLAELGTDGTSTDRRFFHAPDLVQTFDNLGNFDGVLIESGNRADPLEEDVENYMFYIKDREIRSGSAIVRSENDVADPPGRYVFDSDEVNGLTDRTECVTGSEVGCDIAVNNGWKIQLTRSGEKGLAPPLVDAGRVFFTTYRPGGTVPCAPTEGQGSLYVVNLKDGTAAANNQRFYDVGPGIPPPVILIGDVLKPPGPVALRDLDGDGQPDLEPLIPSLTRPIFKIYWREPGIDKM